MAQKVGLVREEYVGAPDHTAPEHTACVQHEPARHHVQVVQRRHLARREGLHLHLARQAHEARGLEILEEPDRIEPVPVHVQDRLDLQRRRETGDGLLGELGQLGLLLPNNVLAKPQRQFPRDLMRLNVDVEAV